MKEKELKIKNNKLLYDDDEIKLTLSKDALELLFDFFEKDYDAKEIPFQYFVKYFSGVISRENMMNVLLFLKKMNLIEKINYKGNRMISFLTGDIKKLKEWKDEISNVSPHLREFVDEVNNNLVNEKLNGLFDEFNINNEERYERAIFINNKLMSINLMNCGIIDLNDVDLSYFSDLKSINLMRNKIRKIEKHHFKNLKNIREIKLGYNNIEKLDHECFSSNLLLKNINLEYNHLREVDNRIFEDLNEIESINLRKNQLRDINFLKPLKGKIMRYLNLSENIELENFNIGEFRNVTLDDAFLI